MDLNEKLKTNVIKQLTHNQQDADKVYLVAGMNRYSRNQIAKEIEDETEFGIDFLGDMIMLAIDLTARQKI